MIYFPNAKINIGLQITGKREDGYHNIETVFYPVGLSDIVEIIPEPDKSVSHNGFVNTGYRIDSGESGNLCLRAWSEMNKIRSLPFVRIHLHKIIPVGAGLGGGSSDAAFMLRGLNDLFELDLSLQELIFHAGNLGSDCPFFIYNEPVIARERGDVFESLDLDLSGLCIIIVHPGINISSARAYSKINVGRHSAPLSEIVTTDISRWQGNIINDFEHVLFDDYPVIRNIRDRLISAGAVYSSMTGSGSAVYGLFEHETDTGIFKNEFPGMFVWKGIL
ncbi:MAG: 4-(cytidine 5'-diphospho)-2-C-methyl-D-erythritol kinase [Bacteroidales bacterium]